MFWYPNYSRAGWISQYILIRPCLWGGFLVITIPVVVIIIGPNNFPDFICWGCQCIIHIFAIIIDKCRHCCFRLLSMFVLYVLLHLFTYMSRVRESYTFKMLFCIYSFNTRYYIVLLYVLKNQKKKNVLNITFFRYNLLFVCYPLYKYIEYKTTRKNDVKNVKILYDVHMCQYKDHTALLWKMIQLGIFPTKVI